MGPGRTASISRNLLSLVDVSRSQANFTLAMLTRCSMSKLLDKMNTFPCTQFIEEGCLALQQKGDFKTDRDLYHVIRLQRIIESIDTLATQSSSEAEAQSSYLRVRSELEEFRAFLCSDFSDSREFHPSFLQSSNNAKSMCHIRSTLHAIPHSKTIPLSSRFLRTKPTTLASYPSQHTNGRS